MALRAALPLRARLVTLLSAPMFGTWGLANLLLGLGLQSTSVVRRGFEPAETVGLFAAQQASALVAVSSAALPASVAEQVMDEFGDVVPNQYGSTEVSYVTVANPQDFRGAPGTAARPLHRVTVPTVYDSGAPMPTGGTGRIFAGSPLTFGGHPAARTRSASAVLWRLATSGTWTTPGDCSSMVATRR